MMYIVIGCLIASVVVHLALIRVLIVAISRIMDLEIAVRSSTSAKGTQHE